MLSQKKPEELTPEEMLRNGQQIIEEKTTVPDIRKRFHQLLIFHYDNAVNKNNSVYLKILSEFIKRLPMRIAKEVEENTPRCLSEDQNNKEIIEKIENYYSQGQNIIEKETVSEKIKSDFRSSLFLHYRNALKYLLNPAYALNLQNFITELPAQMSKEEDKYRLDSWELKMVKIHESLFNAERELLIGNPTKKRKDELCDSLRDLSADFSKLKESQPEVKITPEEAAEYVPLTPFRFLLFQQAPTIKLKNATNSNAAESTPPHSHFTRGIKRSHGSN